MTAGWRSQPKRVSPFVLPGAGWTSSGDRSWWLFRGRGRVPLLLHRRPPEDALVPPELARAFQRWYDRAGGLQAFWRRTRLSTQVRSTGA